jgi:hypothetical protein
LLVVKRWPLGGREVGSKSDILLPFRSASTISIWQLWCECALHGSNILNCAALRSAFCLASPSSNCFASLARASACSSRWSAVKNATFFLLRMPGLISVSTNCCQTNRAVRIATGWMQLAFDGCGRILCSAASSARTRVARA